ncbi:MAG: hypothetical protein DMD92_12145 [Candidatus Rokuibacteriota bacterium]|nr:MAG: hypothetical protein DMD92_12145 [Candidatus Rokubacteria bacterium]
MTPRWRSVPAGLAVVLLVGCAEREWIYEKKNVTPTRYDRDMAICRQEALDPKAFALFASGRVNRDMLNRCMERKGYAVRRGK